MGDVEHGRMEPSSAGARLKAGWRAAFVVVLVGATWILLTPRPPPSGTSVAGSDLVKHAILFALLASLAAFAFPRRRSWTIVGALIAYGVAIEILQPLTGRDASALDAVADAVGALAVVVVRLVTRRAR